MASSFVPVRAAAYSFEVALSSRADTKVFQASPTLAAGDVQISKDGGAFVNITTLPTAIGGGPTLTVALSADEMDADRIVVRFQDATGAEWCDLQLPTIYTAALGFDDIAAAVWSYGKRMLTVPLDLLGRIFSGDAIVLQTHATWTYPLSGLGSLTNRYHTHH